MTEIIEKPFVVDAAGAPPKRIEEYVGLLNTPSNAAMSIARMVSPGGWSEPGQTPDFVEYSLILRGSLRIETNENVFTVESGQAFIAQKGKWIRYSTPEPEGAEYISVCLPAFSPDTVHRDDPP